MQSANSAAARAGRRWPAPLPGGVRAAPLLIVVSTLGGCIPNAVVPDTQIDVPGSYRYAGAKPGLQDHAVDWWVAFRSPELTGFMEETEVGNFSVAAAIAQVSQADATARQTGSALFPTLNASNSFTRSGTGSGSTSAATAGSAVSGTTSGGVSTASSGTGAGTGLGTGTSTSALGSSLGGTVVTSSFTAAFSAAYQLDVWGRFRALYQGSQDNATASRWNRQEVQLTQLGSTATTYFNVLAARERVTFARQDVVDSSRILKLIEDRIVAESVLEETFYELWRLRSRVSCPPDGLRKLLLALATRRATAVNRDRR